MRYLRFSIRALLVVLMLFVGLICAAVLLPISGHSVKEFEIKLWSRVLMFVCGVKIKRSGKPILSGPVMWVANHVSWIDIFVLNSCRMTSFVAKSEIRKWPVIGWLTAAVGTIFIERNNRQAIPEVSKRVEALLKDNYCVGIFPEGTTTDGADILPLYSGLFSAPMANLVPIQPIALVFYHQGKRSGLVSFIGEQTLVHNIWVLLSSKGVCVEAVFLPPITYAGEAAQVSRQQLAEQVRQAIREKLVN